LKLFQRHSKLAVTLSLALVVSAVGWAAGGGSAFALSAARCRAAATGSWKYNCTAREGDYSTMVMGIQEALLELQNCSTQLKSDGDFGPITKAAVKCYQDLYGLPVTGVVNSTTWAYLQGTIDSGYVVTRGKWVYYGTGIRKWKPSGAWYVHSNVPWKGPWYRMDTKAP
jgi:hypothetical protein